MSVLLLLRGLRLHDGDKLTLAVTGGTALYRGVLIWRVASRFRTIHGGQAHDSYAFGRGGIDQTSAKK